MATRFGDFNQHSPLAASLRQKYEVKEIRKVPMRIDNLSTDKGKMMEMCLLGGYQVFVKVPSISHAVVFEDRLYLFEEGY